MKGRQAGGDYREFEAVSGKRISSVTSFASGMSARVEGLLCEDGSRFVAKAYPSRKRGKEALLREWRGLSELYAAGVRVPLPVHLHAEGPDPWFVMEWVKGMTFIDAWEAWDAGERARKAGELIALVSQMHGARSPGLLEEEAMDTAWFVGRERASCALAIDRGAYAFLMPLIAWLEEEARTLKPLPVGIIMRDLHPWNILVNEDGELFLIDLDWARGDPRFDLAWMLNTLELGSKQDMAHELSRLIGEGPEASAGGMGYFSVLSRLRWLLDVLDSLEEKGPPSGQDGERFVSFLKIVISRLAEQTGLSLSFKDPFQREGA